MAAAVKEAATRVGSQGEDWTTMEQCPFAELRDRDDADGLILVTDGKQRTVARVILNDLSPSQWHQRWRLIGVLERPAWSYGDGMRRGDIGFVPTLWRFLPKPPA